MTTQTLQPKHIPIILQIIRFGLIGLLAAIIHLTNVMLMVEFIKLHPLLANIIAFNIAFCFSYLGHKHWTFASTRARPSSLRRFYIVALTGFALNETLYYLLLTLSALHYATALGIVLAIVPPLTFVLSKFWAFSPKAANDETFDPLRG